MPTDTYYDINGQLISAGDKIKLLDRHCPDDPLRLAAIDCVYTINNPALAAHGRRLATVTFGIPDGSHTGEFGVRMDRITKITDEEYDEGIVLNKLTKV